VVGANQQAEDLLTKLARSQERLRPPTATAERGDQLIAQTLCKTEPLLGERRPTVDLRPPLTEERHQREHITGQSSVTTPLANAGDDVSLDQAT
jgi:hypothetical protein